MRKKLLLFPGCALLAGGALALFWYGSLQMEMARTQRAAASIVDETTEPAKKSPRTVVIVPPRPGDALGRIEIPRVHLSAMVVEGISPKTLRSAAGHVPGTALPGVVGNVGIAGHRDTLFRPLREVRPRDEIVVTTSYGTFHYVVDSTEVVAPRDTEVLHKTSDAELTLVTCFPFYYAGPAPKRFIVHARKRASAPQAEVCNFGARRFRAALRQRG